MNDQTRPAVGTAIALPSDPMQLMALARELALARLIPPHFQKSPADCWLVMSFCRNRNLDFMMVVGECSVVQGRLFFSGKLTAALLNTSGYLAERLNYEYTYKEGKPYAVVVSGRLTNEPTPRNVQVMLEEVKTANKVWTTQPEQQLAYAGARIWGRRHCPEVLMGLLFEGEQIIDVTPTEAREAYASGSREVSVEPPKQELKPVAHDKPKPAADPVEVEPYELEINERNSEEEWKRWGNDLFAYIKAAKTFQRIDEWIVANSDGFEALKHYDVGKFNRLRHMIQAQQDAKAKDAQP